MHLDLMATDNSWLCQSQVKREVRLIKGRQILLHIVNEVVTIATMALSRGNPKACVSIAN